MRLCKGIEPLNCRGEHAVAEEPLGHVKRQLGLGLGLLILRLAKRGRHSQTQRQA